MNHIVFRSYLMYLAATIAISNLKKGELAINAQKTSGFG